MSRGRDGPVCRDRPRLRPVTKTGWIDAMLMNPGQIGNLSSLHPVLVTGAVQQRWRRPLRRHWRGAVPVPFSAARSTDRGDSRGSEPCRSPACSPVGHYVKVTPEHLNAEIAATEQRIVELETVLAQSRIILQNLLAQRAATTRTAAPIPQLVPTTGENAASSERGATPRVTRDSPATDKVALFRSLFIGRADVYASRWTSNKTGKSGWSPAVRGGFYTDAVTAKDMLPLSDDVIAKHLMGNRTGADGLHVGLYAMLPDDTCRFLACDFDDGNWKADAAAYVAACTRHRVCSATEISRSGDGAHVWIFFSEPVPAQLARGLGLALLRDAMAHQNGMSLTSYDRLFPSQDLLPTRSPGRMRLGNLIALPLGRVSAPGHNRICRSRDVGALRRSIRLPIQPGTSDPG